MEGCWIHVLITAGLLSSLSGGTHLLNPALLYVHEGERVEIECGGGEVGGATWTRGGREIRNGTHYTIYPGRLLVIMNVTADITGHNQPYQCGNSSNVTVIIIEVELAVTMATPLETPSYDRTQAIVISSILGTCALLVITVLLLCGLLYCVHKDFDPDLERDAVEYNIEEEYEARLDPHALARLEPDVRSKIDLSFLGRIADTQPQMLAEFTQCSWEKGMKADTDISPASSLGRSCHSPVGSIPSHQSSASNPHSMTPDGPCTFLSSTPLSSSPQPTGPRRYSTQPFCHANTISDFTPSIEVVEGGVDSPTWGLVRFLKRTPVAPTHEQDTLQ